MHERLKHPVDSTLVIFNVRRSNASSKSLRVQNIKVSLLVRGDAVLRCFWCGFSEFFLLTCGVAVFQDCAVCGNLKF